MNVGRNNLFWLVVLSVISLAAVATRATVYVVDQAAPIAADTNPGTEEKPWKTIQHAADTAGPGDTVCVMQGAYPERVTLKKSGAEGKPVIFRSCPLRGAEVYGFSTGKADWVTIQGFRLHAPKPEKMVASIKVSSNHVEVLDNYCYGLYGAIFLAFSSSPGKDKEPDSPSDDHIAYNEIYQCQECVWLFGRK